MPQSNELLHVQGAVLSAVMELSENPAVARALRVIVEEVPFAMEEQAQLCEIPAPTFHEGKRAEAMMEKLRAYGLSDIKRDAIGNVIARRPGSDPEAPVLALVAHMDTVFPEGTDCTVKREGLRFSAPGIGDNASGLRSLLQVLRAMTSANIETVGDVLFVADVQEEGAGDLNGSKALVDEMHLDGLIALDGSDVGRIQKGGTACRNWRFVADGPGGHSWGAFGKVPSAVHAVARATAEIADFSVPADPKTSFNVGMITGGSGATSFAEHCEAEVDFRSNDARELDPLEKRFFEAFERGVRAENERWGITDPEKMVRLSTVRTGDIPGGFASDECPVIQAAGAAQKVLGIALTNYGFATTDANPAFAKGIPATCLGSGGVGTGAHSLAESYLMEDIHLGPQLALLASLALVGVKGASEPMLSKKA